MKVRNLIVAAAALGVILPTVPVRAHHAFAAEYDADKPITLVGTVTKLEWLSSVLRTG
jgi:hypothetical protein